MPARKTASERKPTRGRRAINAEIKAQLLAMRRDSDWTLFLDSGFALYTACGWCQEQTHCRGSVRERVACEGCYKAKGRPKDTAFLAGIESVVKIPVKGASPGG